MVNGRTACQAGSSQPEETPARTLGFNLRCALGVGRPAFALFGPAMLVASLGGAGIRALDAVAQGYAPAQAMYQSFLPVLSHTATGLLVAFVLIRVTPERLWSSPYLVAALIATYAPFLISAVAGMWVAAWTWSLVHPQGDFGPFGLRLSYLVTVASLWLLVALLSNHFEAIMVRRRHYEGQLREKLLELEESRRRIVDVQEQLRKEIAETLHGRVQNRLLLAVHYLKEAVKQMDAQPEQARLGIEESCRLVQEINLKELRHIARRLHPSIIRVGLRSALQSLVEGYDDLLSVYVEVQNGVPTQENPGGATTPEGIRLALYRIAEEALNNVVKHSRATSARVVVKMSPDGKLSLTVADNGVGFDTASMKPGMGLRSAMDYCGAHGGRLIISSTPGRGTTVQAELPLGLGQAVDQTAVPSMSVCSSG